MDGKISTSVFVGKLRSFKLVSNNICYGPCPEPEDIIEQHLSIRADGRVWLSFYQFGTGIKFKKAESKQFSISQSQAEYILTQIQSYFETAESELFATDVGEWSIELTNDSKEKFKWRGSLIPSDDELDNISDIIRASLDMPDLFCFDGAYKNDRIENIRIDYHRQTKIRPSVIHDGATWEFVTWDYNEHLCIDRETETIEHFQKIGQECDITRTYHVGEGVSDFLDGYDVETFLSKIIGNPDDAVDDPMEEKTYRVEIKFKYLDPRIITGTYDKKALPDDWQDFMDDVWEFIRFYGLGEIMDPGVFGKVKRCRGDYMFVFVTFDEYGQEYSYLCNDDSISDGDRVLVPVGNDGKTSIATVTRVEYHPAEEAPYPVNKIKNIIRAVDENELVPSKDNNEKKTSASQQTYVMSSDPCAELSVEDVSELIEKIKTEKELADLFSVSNNKAWWVEDDVYDYEEGTVEYQKAYAKMNQWFAIADELKEKIFAILREEGISIPESGQISVLLPFMERNGYFDGNGWWIPREEK